MLYVYIDTHVRSIPGKVPCFIFFSRCSLTFIAIQTLGSSYMVCQLCPLQEETLAFIVMPTLSKHPLVNVRGRELYIAIVN